MASAAIIETPIRADLNGRPRPVTIEQFIDKHICADVTALVALLARNGHKQASWPLTHETNEAFNDLRDECLKAEDLSAPFLDYEAAARARGWRKEGNSWYVGYGAMMQQRYEEDLTPYEIPTIGHYIVTAELADKLEALGERVERDFGGSIVWARKQPGTHGRVQRIDGVAFPLDRDPVLLAICAAEAI